MEKDKGSVSHHVDSPVERPDSGVIEQTSVAQITACQSWIERKLRPTKMPRRCPFVGRPLLWMTCGFGSLGDALFGYDSGKSLMAGFLPLSLDGYTDM